MTTKVVSKGLQSKKATPKKGRISVGRVLFVVFILIIIGIFGAMMFGLKNAQRMNTEAANQSNLVQLIKASASQDFVTNDGRCSGLTTGGTALCKVSNSVFKQCASSASNWAGYNTCAGQFELDFCINSTPNQTVEDVDVMLKCQDKVRAFYKIHMNDEPESAQKLSAK